MGVLLQRTSLILGLLSLVFALLSGIHLQHMLSDGGGRHPGEFAVLIVLALWRLPVAGAEPDLIHAHS